MPSPGATSATGRMRSGPVALPAPARQAPAAAPAAPSARDILLSAACTPSASATDSERHCAHDRQPLAALCAADHVDVGRLGRLQLLAPRAWLSGHVDLRGLGTDDDRARPLRAGKGRLAA